MPIPHTLSLYYPSKYSKYRWFHICKARPWSAFPPISPMQLDSSLGGVWDGKPQARSFRNFNLYKRKLVTIFWKCLQNLGNQFSAHLGWVDQGFHGICSAYLSRVPIGLRHISASKTSDRGEFSRFGHVLLLCACVAPESTCRIHLKYWWSKNSNSGLPKSVVLALRYTHFRAQGSDH